MIKGDQYIDKKTDEVAIIDSCIGERVKATVTTQFYIGKIDCSRDEFNHGYAFTGRNEVIQNDTKPEVIGEWLDRY